MGLSAVHKEAVSILQAALLGLVPDSDIHYGCPDFKWMLKAGFKAHLEERMYWETPVQPVWLNKEGAVLGWSDIRCIFMMKSVPIQNSLIQWTNAHQAQPLGREQKVY